MRRERVLPAPQFQPRDSLRRRRELRRRHPYATDEQITLMLRDWRRAQDAQADHGTPVHDSFHASRCRIAGAGSAS